MKLLRKWKKKAYQLNWLLKQLVLARKKLMLCKSQLWVVCCNHSFFVPVNKQTSIIWVCPILLRFSLRVFVDRLRIFFRNVSPKRIFLYIFFFFTWIYYSIDILYIRIFYVRRKKCQGNLKKNLKIIFQR